MWFTSFLVEKYHISTYILSDNNTRKKENSFGRKFPREEIQLEENIFEEKIPQKKNTT